MEEPPAEVEEPLSAVESTLTPNWRQLVVTIAGAEETLTGVEEPLTVEEGTPICGALKPLSCGSGGYHLGARDCATSRTVAELAMVCLLIRERTVLPNTRARKRA